MQKPPFRSVLTPLIVEGRVDTTHEAVVALVVLPHACGAPTKVVCTGTVVAPRVVLTAAHCIGHLPLGDAEVVLGRAIEATDARHIRISQTLRHPDWVSPSHDVALVQLAEDAGVAPVALIDTAHAAAWAPDSVLTLVGYGRDQHGRTGTRRFGSARVSEILPEHFRVRPEPALSCQGDSGGPALALGDGDGIERVAGVSSYGDPNCIETAAYARLDIELAGFVTSGIQQLQGSGEPLRLPTSNQCDVACRTDSDCPTAWSCVEARCGYHGLPPGRLAGHCSSDSECSGGMCVAAGGCSCYESCSSGASLESDGSCALASRGPAHASGLALVGVIALVALLFRRR